MRSLSGISHTFQFNISTNLQEVLGASDLTVAPEIEELLADAADESFPVVVAAAPLVVPDPEVAFAPALVAEHPAA